MTNEINFTELDKVEAIGNLIATYHSDLKYIQKFQHFKSNYEQLELNDYTNYFSKGESTFYSFLTEFRIIRNINQGTAQELFNYTLSFINKPIQIDVDEFALLLQKKSKITRNQKPVSLSSKVLFLNNPWEIIPMDQLTRKVLNMKSNKYIDYTSKLEDFRTLYKPVIDDCLIKSDYFINTIHNEFDDIKNLNAICRNRIIDKLLWTKGKK